MSQPQVYPTVAYTFDPNQHAPDTGNDPIPAGVYDVTVHKVTLRSNKDEATGWHCAVSFKVINGEYTGREVTNNYNLGHAMNAMAVDIAHKQFSALLHVLGYMQQLNFAVAGGREIEGRQLKINVSSDGKYNEIKGVMDTAGNRPVKAGSGVNGGAPVAVATPTAGGSWGGAAPAAVATPAPGFAQPAAVAPQPTYAPVAPAMPAQPAMVQPQPNWSQPPAAQPVMTQPAAAQPVATAGAPTPPWAAAQPTAA